MASPDEGSLPLSASAFYGQKSTVLPPLDAARRIRRFLRSRRYHANQDRMRRLGCHPFSVHHGTYPLPPARFPSGTPSTVSTASSAAPRGGVEHARGATSAREGRGGAGRPTRGDTSQASSNPGHDGRLSIGAAIVGSMADGEPSSIQALRGLRKQSQGRFTPRRFVPNLHRERARTGDPPSPVYPDARRGSTVPSGGTVEQAWELAPRHGSPRGRHVFGGSSSPDRGAAEGLRGGLTSLSG